MSDHLKSTNQSASSSGGSAMKTIKATPTNPEHHTNASTVQTT